jgi:hypothetical protein
MRAWWVASLLLAGCLAPVPPPAGPAGAWLEALEAPPGTRPLETLGLPVRPRPAQAWMLTDAAAWAGFWPEGQAPAVDFAREYAVVAAYYASSGAVRLVVDRLAVVGDALEVDLVVVQGCRGGHHAMHESGGAFALPRPAPSRLQARHFTQGGEGCADTRRSPPLLEHPLDLAASLLVQEPAAGERACLRLEGDALGEAVFWANWTREAGGPARLLLRLVDAEGRARAVEGPSPLRLEARWQPEGVVEVRLPADALPAALRQEVRVEAAGTLLVPEGGRPALASAACPR